MRNVYVELDYIVGVKPNTRTFSISPDETGEGRLESPLKFSTKVRTWVQSEQTSSGLSKITINNSDGALDSFADETFTECRIKENVNGTTSTLATAQVDRVVLNGLKFMEVNLKDARKLLDKPIQDNYFGSTVTSQRDATTITLYGLQGQPKPICVANLARLCAPVLLSRSKNEYWLHDEDIFDVFDVFDNGASVSFTQTTNGFYLSADPAGVITCDIRGQENVANTARLRLFNEIMEYLLDIRESISYSSTDADTINTDKGYNFSYYQSNLENPTINQVIKQFTDSVTGWFYADESGDIRFGYLQEPAVFADVEISVYDIIDSVKVFDDIAPNITTFMGGGMNFYRYNQGDIAASVSDEDTINFSSDYQSVEEGATALDDFYTSTGLTQPSLLGGPNAEDEIDHVTDLYSQRRKFYTFDSAVDAQIGETVELTYPRFGLDAGVNLLCLGREIDFINNTYRLTLWG